MDSLRKAGLSIGDFAEKLINEGKVDAKPSPPMSGPSQVEDIGPDLSDIEVPDEIVALASRKVNEMATTTGMIGTNMAGPQPDPNKLKEKNKKSMDPLNAKRGYTSAAKPGKESPKESGTEYYNKASRCSHGKKVEESYLRMFDILEGWSTGQSPAATGARVGKFLKKKLTKGGISNKDYQRSDRISRRIGKRDIKRGKDKFGSGFSQGAYYGAMDLKKNESILRTRGKKESNEGKSTGGDPIDTGRRVGKFIKKRESQGIFSPKDWERDDRIASRLSKRSAKKGKDTASSMYNQGAYHGAKYSQAHDRLKAESILRIFDILEGWSTGDNAYATGTPQKFLEEGLKRLLRVSKSQLNKSIKSKKDSDWDKYDDTHKKIRYKEDQRAPRNLKRIKKSRGRDSNESISPENILDVINEALGK